ncbi:MAG: tetratricopeptide repeat protein [Planctomycetota bacterium]|jgi:tetratricopeptide (TPR) repeat protein
MTAVVLEPEAPGAERRLFVPAWRTQPAVRPGEVVEVQVVVRNQGTGHAFPGGTIDSNEVWVAFEAAVGEGEPFYVSGALDPETRRVDPTAEFYRSYLMDREGNRVVNRLGPDIYTRVYARVIGPGTADVVRYRFRVPDDATGALRLRATLRYRKFMQEYLDFLFPETKVIEHRLDDGTVRTVDLDGLPIQDLAETDLELAITEDGTSVPAPDPADVARPADRLRVNDLGIAYLLQSDSYGAERLFEAVTRIDPDYADGWVNVARARIANADWGGALQALAQAREVQPGFKKARFFEGQIHSRLAQWKQAERAYREVLSEWPRERQALRGLAEALYEQDRFREAVETIERLFAIDPEDAQGWFWAYRALTQLGDEDRARAAGEDFERFRQDDSEPQRAGEFQLADPILQRLAQPIHVHLGPGAETRSPN